VKLHERRRKSQNIFTLRRGTSKNEGQLVHLDKVKRTLSARRILERRRSLWKKLESAAEEAEKENETNP
jgi:hypothetical protein